MNFSEVMKQFDVPEAGDGSRESRSRGPPEGGVEDLMSGVEEDLELERKALCALDTLQRKVVSAGRGRRSLAEGVLRSIC